MSPHTPADIYALCDKWCRATSQDASSIHLGNSEHYRLTENNVVFHELNHETLCASIIGLSQVLLRPGFNSIIHFDHYFLWSWCAELLLNPYDRDIFPAEQQEIRSLYVTTLRAALAPCSRPVEIRTVDEWRKHTRQLSQGSISHHARELLQRSHIILAHVAFPLLEAVLRRACSKYVTFDGKVISTFSVPRKDGTLRSYTAGKGECSSIRDLLYLLRDTVAEQALKEALELFCRHVEFIDSTGDPFDMIFTWRNQTLHGSTGMETIGGTVLCLALLISLFDIQENFEGRRLKAVDCCEIDETPQVVRAGWEFYPPY